MITTIAVLCLSGWLIVMCILSARDNKRKMLIRNHKFSSNHRDSVLTSTIAGCFYCENVFKSCVINEWTDDEKTALCPICGIDSVICDKDVPNISLNMLKGMNRIWFTEL